MFRSHLWLSQTATIAEVFQLVNDGIDGTPLPRIAPFYKRRIAIHEDEVTSPKSEFPFSK